MNYPQIKQEQLSADPEGGNANVVLANSFNGTGLKRRRTDEGGQCEDIAMTSPAKIGSLIITNNERTASCIQQHNASQINVAHLKNPTGKTFLHIQHSPCIYQTEDWKPKGCTMYLPLSEDVMVNTRNIEQISFESDQFFLADEKGNYVGAKPGNAIHLWRFDLATRKLYISRSILFLKEQEYKDIRLQLEVL